MDLKTFLQMTNTRQKDFAEQVGSRQSSISMIINGLRRPSPGLALRIERATGGAVRAAEMIFGQDLKADDQDAA